MTTPVFLLRRVLLGLGVLVGVSLCSQGSAASIFPEQFVGMQSADAAMNGIGPSSPVGRQAKAVGIQCDEYRYFLYDNPTIASQSVTSWLSQVGFEVKNMQQDDQVSEWAAARGHVFLYGLWQARDVQQPGKAAPGGTLELCAGKLIRDETTSGFHLRFPLWSLLGIGGALAGGVSRSIHKSAFSPEE